MKFFIPHLKELADPEKIFESLCRFAEETMGWKVERDVRVFALDYTDFGKQQHTQVGRDLDSGELVTAILVSSAYIIVTFNREEAQIPKTVGIPRVKLVEYFEGYSPTVAKNKK